MLIYYRESDRSAISSKDESQPVRSNPIALLKAIFSNRPLALLFLAYFLISDALITFSNNFPLYLEAVHGVSDTVKSVLTAMILILSAGGCIVFGKIADKKGSLKVLKIIVLIWILFLLAASVLTDFSTLVPLFIIAGILFGPVWAISRSMVGQITPPHLTASSYGYYVVAERFATLIGPLVWSMTLVLAGEGPKGYQTTLFALSIMLAVGYLVLRKIKILPMEEMSPIKNAIKSS